MSIRIRVTGDASRWAELPPRGKLVIGSDSERADFVLDGQGVDAAHCAIGKLKDGGWAIKDLGSKYGSILNGKPVESARLAAGDRLVVGSRSLELYDPLAKTDDDGFDDEIVLEEATPPNPVAPQSAEPEPATSRGDSKRLGGFRLDRPLGRGGMGEVWLALQESLNRPVALKILSTKLAANAEFVAQFQAEARAAAALSHPNVVVVHDVGAADGHHYLAMEFMAGGSLEDRVTKEGPLPWRKVLEALSDAGKGLTYAEERKIVHRDIKPANLMVGGQGTIKIADLGLATSSGDGIDAGGTQKILGTPHFIAPEQARGEPIDHRADLYALGGTAFRLLTGRTPFEGETTREILRGHLTEDPPVPSELVPGIPPGLDDLVLKLLEKEPADRFDSAKALVTAVDRLRLESDNVSLPEVKASGSGGVAKLLVPLIAVVALVAGGAFFLLGQSKDGDTEAGSTGNPSTSNVASAGGNPDDGSFFEANGTTGDGSANEDQLEKDLEVKNLRAKNAYLELADDLTDAERIEELEAIAAEFPGTAIAQSCADEAHELRSRLDQETARVAALDGLRATSLSDLKAALSWPPSEGSTFRLVDHLRGLNAFRAPSDLSGDTLWESQVAGLRTEILSLAHESLAARFEAAGQLKDDGRFDDYRAELVGLLSELELPEDGLPEGDASVSELKRLATLVRTAREGLEADMVLFAQEVAKERRQRLAGLFGPGSSGLDAFASLDFAALETIAAELANFGDESAGSTIGRALTAEVPKARAAIDGLVRGWNESRWRRKTMSDPTDKRRASRDVLGVNADGLALADANGEPKIVAWGVLLSDPDTVEQLFKNRLDRDYTTDEVEGIAALARWSLAGRIGYFARRALTKSEIKSTDKKSFAATLRSVRSMLDWQEFAASDVQGARDRLAAELAACELLERTFEASSEDAWAQVVVMLESFYSDHEACLVCQFLSDASDWRDG